MPVGNFDMKANVIGERILKAKGNEEDIIVRFLKPRKKAPYEYVCIIEFVIGDSVKRLEVFGCDSLQSLTIALEAAGKWIDENYPGFRWLGGLLNHGFPELIPFNLGQNSKLEIRELIEQKISEEAKQRGIQE
jgi:hypothetical protein